MVHPSLLIMAAGAGSRFGGPKQMAPVGPNGEWLMEYSIFDAVNAGFRRVVFVTRAEHEAMYADVIGRLGPHVEARTVVQDTAARPKPWGTGHAVLSAADAVPDTFAVINADDFYGADAYRHAARACDRASDTGRATVIVMRLDRTLSTHGAVTRGICRVEGTRILEIREVAGIGRPDARIIDAAGKHYKGDELVSMNFWVFPPTIFRVLSARFEVFRRQHHEDPDEEFRLPDVIDDLVRKDALELEFVEVPGPWFGLTHAADVEDVSTQLRELSGRGEYPASLW